MASEIGLSFAFNPSGPDGIGNLSASYGETAIFTNRIQITDLKSREEFISKVIESRAGVNPVAMRAELEKLAGKAVENAAKQSRERFNQSDLLLKLADSAELFVDDDTEYATVPVELPKPHRETYRIRDRQFRKWLSAAYFRQSERAASAAPMQDAIETLCGKAANGGIVRKVAIRIGESGGNVYLDLANPEWQAVEISRDGWRIISDPPIRFIRKRGMEELPAPIDGGSLDELRPLINAPDDETWILLIAWLVGAMNPSGPYPILAVNGEQGSAKSTLCRMLRKLIDPNVCPLRAAPRDERDLVIAASNSWIVLFDNLSSIRAEMSDALCRLSTGGGFSTRELHSDDSEKLFNVCRAQLLNGIEELNSKNDLLDRGIAIRLNAIPDEMRRPEAELWAKFAELRTQLLGALCNAVARALRERGNVKLAKLPRLADFALWVCAAESALPWEPGRFIAAYESNRRSANAAALESSRVAQAVIELMASRECWTGSAQELMTALEQGELADGKVRDRLGWPKTPRGMSGELDRTAPILRRTGFTIIKGEREGRGRKRIIRIERAAHPPSAPSAIVPSGDSEPPMDGLADDASLYQSPDRPPDSPQSGAENGETDDADGVDGMALADSAYAGGF